MHDVCVVCACAHIYISTSCSRLPPHNRLTKKYGPESAFAVSYSFNLAVSLMLLLVLPCEVLLPCNLLMRKLIALRIMDKPAKPSQTLCNTILFA